MSLATESTFLATVNDCFLELFVKALTRKQADLVLNNTQGLVQVETMKGTSLLQQCFKEKLAKIRPRSC